jgi:hypothetical protein
MRDEETGTWWQQVSGEAVLGPLAGRKLKQVIHDELSFGLWKRETPDGRVLKPDENTLTAGRYATSDWEERMSKTPVVTQPADKRLAARETIVGVSLNGKAKAYPLASVRQFSPVVDTVGGVPILIVVGEDRKSVRAFERTVDGKELQFFAKAGEAAGLLDSATGSGWNFKGQAVNGALAGKQLRKIPVINDYWFDWMIYHPGTDVDLMLRPQ